MSLYGLDLIIDQQGKYYLLEINGIRSGMNGFRRVYGDDRVREKVYGMLQENYGALTVNNGSYLREKWIQKHPLRWKWRQLCQRLLPQRTSRLPRLLRSPAAEIQWLAEKISTPEEVSYPWPVYEGQDSTVFNVVNQLLPHPTVNPFVDEEIAANKFLQYCLLKNSPIADLLLPTALVGLGWANESELETVVENSSEFVKKPILGNCGKGVMVLMKEQVELYIPQLDDWSRRSWLDELSLLVLKKPLQKRNLIDFVRKGNYLFEYGLSIIQPFIDSRQTINGEDHYTSIRAIVCNGQFVDAYLRYSPEKKVNLSQGAGAHPFHEKDLAALCENVVLTFESHCLPYDPATFQWELYKSYFQSSIQQLAQDALVSVLIFISPEGQSTFSVPLRTSFPIKRTMTRKK